MSNFTTIQKLDNVLLELKDYQLHELGGLITNLRLLRKTYYEIDELRIALKKMINDGFVHMLFFDNYTISLEGDLFIGYEKQQKLDNERLTSIDQMAIATRKYNTRLLWATWCAGIAAALLLLWQVFLYLYPPHSACDFFYH